MFITPTDKVMKRLMVGHDFLIGTRIKVKEKNCYTGMKGVVVGYNGHTSMGVKVLVVFDGEKHIVDIFTFRLKII